MRILILKEKNGNRYLNASTEEQFVNACLSVIVGRYGPNANWWYANNKPNEPKKIDLGLAREQIRELPEDNPIRKLAADSEALYKQQVKYYLSALYEYEAIVKCVDPATPLEEAKMLAKRIMKQRQDYEYEEWQLEDVEDTY